MKDTRNEMREYFLERKAENEKSLKDSLALGFRLRRVTLDGADFDVTEEYYASLRRAIDEYQKAADMLSTPE